MYFVSTNVAKIFPVNVEFTKELKKELESIKETEVKVCLLDELSGEIDVLVNATPVGMFPKVDNCPVNDEIIKNSKAVFDAIYNPLETQLVQKAKAFGNKAIGGMAMLVWQAVVAQQKWNDEKKELMVQFCIAYCGILSRNIICATGTTGKLVEEATGLEVQKFLGGSQGGDQQIAARIACNEIDMLLFFRDPLNPKPSEPNDMNLLRLCDMHNIPVATNIATAEVLIHGLERGDLDWRNIVK